MDTRQVLINARKRIATKSDWFGGDNPFSNYPSQTCAGIAVIHAVNWDGRFCFAACEHEALRILAVACGGDPRKSLFGQVAAYNNSHTHTEMLAAFDRAIASVTPTDISIFTDMLSTPLVEHQSALDTCGNG